MTIYDHPHLNGTMHPHPHSHAHSDFHVPHPQSMFDFDIHPSKLLAPVEVVKDVLKNVIPPI